MRQWAVASGHFASSTTFRWPYRRPAKWPAIAEARDPPWKLRQRRVSFAPDRRDQVPYKMDIYLNKIYFLFKQKKIEGDERKSDVTYE